MAKIKLGGSPNIIIHLNTLNTLRRFNWYTTYVNVRATNICSTRGFYFLIAIDQKTRIFLQYSSSISIRDSLLN